VARIPERLPFPLSERIASAASSVFARQGKEVDVAIAGIPFRLATIADLPETVETVQVRKEQLDTELDPGEQSLSVWWRRSQSSFHEGAGNLYQESSDSNVAGNGFYDSRGVNVFTPGELSLLGAMSTMSHGGTTASRIRLYTDATGEGLSAVVDGKLYETSDFTTLASLHAPAAKTIVDGFISNDYFYDVASDGTLYEGTVAAPGAATTWPCGATPSRMAWGKHRLWIIGGRKLWQPDLSLAGGSAQNPIFENPNRGWKYTCLAEGPTGMYFGGHDGLTSSIQLVTLDSGGALPTLTGAAVSAILPDGELVQEIAVLAGQLIGIGTSRGFRVGEITQNGSIAYGPLLIEPEGVTACTAITTQGRFFVVAFEGTENPVYRIDTGTVLSEGVYPYARDIECGDNLAVTSLTSNRQYAFATTEDGDAYKQTSTKVAEGYLLTGRIRYRTNERKKYRFVSFECEPLPSSTAIAVEAILEGDSTLAVGTFNSPGATFEDVFALDVDAMRYMSLKFTLTGNTTNSPVINSYLLRALPSVTPARMITLPLLCFDRESAKSGAQYGGMGFARDRLEALQLIEDESEYVVYQDFTNSSGVGQIVTIESMRFIKTNIPAPQKAEGAGGILYVQLRTVVA
jgi:hypothetical protein